MLAAVVLIVVIAAALIWGAAELLSFSSPSSPLEHFRLFVQQAKAFAEQWQIYLPDYGAAQNVNIARLTWADLATIGIFAKQIAADRAISTKDRAHAQTLVQAFAGIQYQTPLNALVAAVAYTSGNMKKIGEDYAKDAVNTIEFALRANSIYNKYTKVAKSMSDALGNYKQFGSYKKRDWKVVKGSVDGAMRQQELRLVAPSLTEVTFEFVGATVGFIEACLSGKPSEIVSSAIGLASVGMGALTYAASTAAPGSALAMAGEAAALVNPVLGGLAVAMAGVKLADIIATKQFGNCPCDFPRQENLGVPVCYKGTCQQEYGKAYTEQPGGGACGINCADAYGSCYYSNGTSCIKRPGKMFASRCVKHQNFRDLKLKQRKTHTGVHTKRKCTWQTRACQQGDISTCIDFYNRPVIATTRIWNHNNALGKFLGVV